MFFAISKVAWFLLQPSTLLLVGFGIGIILVWTGHQRSGLRWLLGSLIAILIVGLTAFADLLTAPLEARFPRPDLAGQTIDGIIVLGGAEDGNGGNREIMSLNEAGERMTEAVIMAKRYPGAVLMFSGGSGALLREDSAAAKNAQAFFMALGIASERIRLEDQSRTTFENAILSRAALQPKPGQRFLLVTSAWHMPRAMGCFRAAGFDVVAWSADYRTSGRVSLWRTFAAVPDGLKRTDAMVKEYVGLLMYFATGRTTALFPGPDK
jgi:uncharacterized SAM-binding protein YcdF (DUF218 family)